MPPGLACRVQRLGVARGRKDKAHPHPAVAGDVSLGVRYRVETRSSRVDPKSAGFSVMTRPDFSSLLLLLSPASFRPHPQFIIFNNKNHNIPKKKSKETAVHPRPYTAQCLGSALCCVTPSPREPGSTFLPSACTMVTVSFRIPEPRLRSPQTGSLLT